MKIRTKFTILGSLAVLATASIAAGDEVAVEPDIAICPFDFKEEPVIIICPGFEVEEGVSIDPVIIDEIGEGTFVEEEIFVEEETIAEEEVTDGEVVEVTTGGKEVDSEVVYDGGEFVVPLDWIKRGGGDNPEIYYSVTNFGGPELTPRSETPTIARQIGLDNKATGIERKENAVFKANREKKGPVAFVKEDRVFLR
jgi:hypothetical protein